MIQTIWFLGSNILLPKFTQIRNHLGIYILSNKYMNKIIFDKPEKYWG